MSLKIGVVYRSRVGKNTKLKCAIFNLVRIKAGNK